MQDVSQSAGFDWFFYICDVTVPVYFSWFEFFLEGMFIEYLMEVIK